MEILNGEPYFGQIKDLIEEYSKELNRNLDFQGFSDELEHLDKKYGAPDGAALIALTDSGEAAGCVCFRKLSKTRCEMKRLYVRPEYRKEKIGRLLAENILLLAKERGYTEMVLDTVRPLQSAVALYQKLGFEETEPYYHNPMPDVIFMKKVL